MNRLVALLVIIIIIVAGVATWYSLDNIRPVLLGLDLRGGTRVTLEPDAAKLEGETLNAETMSRVREVLENRVIGLGIPGAEVRVKGENQILVHLPRMLRPEEALIMLITTARLEFRHLTNVVSDRNPGARYRMSEIAGDSEKGEANSYTFYENSPGGKQVPAEQVIKESSLILKGDALKPTSRAVIAGNAQPQVEFSFEPNGARIFGEFTSDNVGEVLALALDGKIISAPVIRSPITEGSGVIEGGFASMAEARVLANLLNSGFLPVPLRVAAVQYGPPA